MLLTPVTCSRARTACSKACIRRTSSVIGERRTVAARHHELERVRAGEVFVDEERVPMQRRVLFQEADQIGVVVHAG